MDFLTKEDFKAVCDNNTLELIDQQDDVNLARAEKFATEEVSSYLRDRYDIEKAYSFTGDERNAQLVMITCDICLYHLIAWLPRKMGFEIRETRYKSAIEWLKDVQKGKASPNLPLYVSSEGETTHQRIRYGGMEKLNNDY